MSIESSSSPSRRLYNFRLAILVGALLIGNSSQDLYGGLIGWPFQGATLGSIRTIIALFFLIEGGASIMFALEHRTQLTARWKWMLISGAVDVLLGAVIVLDVPGTSAWTMGVLIGINMMLGGISLMAMGWGLIVHGSNNLKVSSYSAS
jgi:uncharacterized membrane protein HdeD (DUF308 family)